MLRKGTACAFALFAAVIGSPAAAATTRATPPASPEPATTVAMFADAPAEARAFFQQAEAADRIDDPLARCLAFPDLPGNQWPAGLAKAYCDFAFGPRITLVQAKALLDRGAVAELDALYAADLEKHFSATAFSEVIHRDFDDFDASYDAGRFTKDWLDKAPTSAYALSARGDYYRAMAWQARGGKWAKDTPDENFARMAEFAKLALDLYDKALKVEPRLMPAYVGLISVSGMASDPARQSRAFKAAAKVDPACVSMMRVTMGLLRPRWDGSYPAMQQYAETMAPFVARRPLIGIHLQDALQDIGNVLWRDKKYDQAIAVLKPATLQTTNVNLYYELGWSMVNAANDWDTMEILLEAARFDHSPDADYQFAIRSLGRLLLLTAKRPDWAARYLKEAVALKPDDSFAHYSLAASYLNGGHYAQAESEYRIAMQDKDQRRDYLRELAMTLLAAHRPQDALVVAKTLNAEYPDFAWGWGMRSDIAVELHDGPGVLEAIHRYVEVADRSDPEQRLEAERLERWLRENVHAIQSKTRR
jgi:tetratricopeptide (TPR) repeat protein